MIFLFLSISVNWPRLFMLVLSAVNFGSFKVVISKGQQMFNSSQMFLLLFANASSTPIFHFYDFAIFCMFFHPFPFKLCFISLSKRIICVPSADLDEFADLYKHLAGSTSAGRLIIPRMAKQPAFVHVDDIDSAAA